LSIRLYFRARFLIAFRRWCAQSLLDDCFLFLVTTFDEVVDFLDEKAEGLLLLAQLLLDSVEVLNQLIKFWIFASGICIFT